MVVKKSQKQPEQPNPYDIFSKYVYAPIDKKEIIYLLMLIKQIV